jgi:hypothetical protein
MSGYLHNNPINLTCFLILTCTSQLTLHLQSKRTLQNLKHFKISVFWDVMLCSASNPWCFKGPHSLQFQGWGLILLGPWRRKHYWSLPMSRTAHPTTQHIPQDWNLQQHRCENIKSCIQNSPFSTTSRLALVPHQPRSLSQEVTSLGCEADRCCPCGATCIFLAWHSANTGTLYCYCSADMWRNRQSSFHVALNSTALLLDW